MARTTIFFATAAVGLAMAGLGWQAAAESGARDPHAVAPEPPAAPEAPARRAADFSRLPADAVDARPTPHDRAIAAIDDPSPAASAPDQRLEVASTLRASGPAAGAPWVARAQAHADEMLAGMRTRGVPGAEALARDCFAAGCAITVRVGAGEDAERAPQAVLDATLGWEGERIIFPAEPEVGRPDSHTVSVFLLSPREEKELR